MLELFRTRYVHLAGGDVRRGRERVHLGGLATGGGAHVEHVLACGKLERERGQHGREALQIDLTGIDEAQVPDRLGVRAGNYKGVLIPAHGFVRNLGSVESGRDLIAGRPDRIGAKRHGALGGRIESGKCL